MGIELSKELMNLMDRPSFGHLATLILDGSPYSAPVWLGISFWSLRKGAL